MQGFVLCLEVGRFRKIRILAGRCRKDLSFNKIRTCGAFVVVVRAISKPGYLHFWLLPNVRTLPFSIKDFIQFPSSIQTTVAFILAIDQPLFPILGSFSRLFNLGTVITYVSSKLYCMRPLHVHRRKRNY